MFESFQSFGTTPSSILDVKSCARGFAIMSARMTSNLGHTPSGPGADFRLQFERTFLIYLGLIGSVLKGWKLSELGIIGSGGSQWRF